MHSNFISQSFALIYPLYEIWINSIPLIFFWMQIYQWLPLCNVGLTDHSSNHWQLLYIIFLTFVIQWLGVMFSSMKRDKRLCLTSISFCCERNSDAKYFQDLLTSRGCLLRKSPSVAEATISVKTGVLSIAMMFDGVNTCSFDSHCTVYASYTKVLGPFAVC